MTATAKDGVDMSDNKLYPYPKLHDEGSTHWVGCYRIRGHHNCAVAMVYQLKKDLNHATECAAQRTKDGVLDYHVIMNDQIIDIFNIIAEHPSACMRDGMYLAMNLLGFDPA